MARLRFRRSRPLAVARLRLEPGDVLVVKVAERVTQEHITAIHGIVSGKVPGHEVLVMPDDLFLSVISPAQAAALKQAAA